MIRWSCIFLNYVDYNFKLVLRSVVCVYSSSTDDDDDSGPDNFKIEAKILFLVSVAGLTISSTNSSSSRVQLPAGGCFAANLPEIIFIFACMIFWRNVGNIGGGCVTN